MRNGCRLVTQYLRKLKGWGIKESHKNGKLDIVAFKLIGQEVHTSGLRANQKQTDQ